MIKLFDPHVSDLEIKTVSSVVNSRFWSSGAGINKVKKFEDFFLKYTGSKACVSVSSGTAALHLALSLFGINKKKVLVPSLTFVSTVNSILYNGGIPVFVEINPKTMCLDVDDVKKKISKKVKAIVPVHFGGMPSNLKELKNISAENNIPIIEDAAHAAGASFNDKKIGSHSEAVCFSFHPIKNLAMPNGGAICLNGKHFDKDQRILKAARFCGIENRNGYNYDVKQPGWNYYLNEISASIGLVQLKKLDRLNKIRKKIALKYYKEISLEHKMTYSEDCSYHLYWIRVKNRNSFMKKMKDFGIQTGVHYNPVHLMTLYKTKERLPITEKIGSEIVSIPIHPNLRIENVEKIISCINKI